MNRNITLQHWRSNSHDKDKRWLLAGSASDHLSFSTKPQRTHITSMQYFINSFDSECLQAVWLERVKGSLNTSSHQWASFLRGLTWWGLHVSCWKTSSGTKHMSYLRLKKELKEKLLKLCRYCWDQAAEPSQIIYSTISQIHHGLNSLRSLW